MAVFTTITRHQLEHYLVMFRLGELVSFKPIYEGTENSNYYVTMEHNGEEKHYVLTLFESLGFNDLPYFSQLMSNLHHYGLPVASPVTTLDGMTTTILAGKPAILFPRLAGAHVMHPTEDHCRIIGANLAELHVTDKPKHLSRDNKFNLAWFTACQDELKDWFAPDDYQILCQVIDEFRDLLSNQAIELPKSLIHGDLFKDNALFDQGQLSGLIDFYHSCSDFLVLDLAITINDWCHDDEQVFQPQLCRALLDGYTSVRILSEAEILSLPVFLKVAATKFWIRRSLLAKKGKQQRDPEEFRKILLGWIATNESIAG